MTSLQVRFLATLTIVGASLVALLLAIFQVTGASLPFSTLWTIIGIAIFSGIVHFQLSRVTTTQWVHYFGSISITLINLSLLTMSALLTGGLDSPFLWVFGMVVLADIIVKGTKWAIVSAFMAVALMTIMAVGIHFDLHAGETVHFFVDSHTFPIIAELAWQTIYLTTIIVMVKIADYGRTRYQFAMSLSIDKRTDIEALLVKMVAPDTVEDTLAIVSKNLEHLIEHDFLAFTKNVRGTLKPVFLKGLPDEAVNTTIKIDKFQKNDRLLLGKTLTIDLGPIPLPKNLRSYNFRNIIVSPLVKNGKLLGILSVGVQNRMVQYQSRDQHIVDMIGKQLLHVWQLQDALHENEEKKQALTAALKEKRQLETLKSEFVSITSHQLRTPLSSIRWFLEMLLNGDFGKMNAQQTDTVEQIMGANQRMIILINDLMDVAKIEDKKLDISKKKVDIIKLTETVIQDHKIIANARNIKLTFSKPSKTLPKGVVDETLMSQVIANLISNGIKYTKARGTVSVNVKKHTKGLILSVKDTGIGISKKDQDKIFTKFYRAADVKKMATAGSGLGLYISKAIMDAMKGEVRIESQKGKGSTFSVIIPTK